MIKFLYRLFNKFFYRYVNNSAVLSKALFRLRLFFIGYKKSEVLILATVTKSGTHYLRFLISYYLLLMENNLKPDSQEIEPDDGIVDNHFPNGWHSAYRFMAPLKRSTKLLRFLSLKDIPRSHMKLRGYEWRGFKVLHTYRPIPDQVAVSYMTKFNCDTKLVNKYNNPWDLYLDSHVDNLDQIKSFQKQKFKGVNTLRIEFGQIHNKPSETLALIIMWLGMEPDLKLCRKSSELASHTLSLLVGAGEKWQREDRENINADFLLNFYKKFAKSGAIGCSKLYFSEEQLLEINRTINK